MQLVKDKNKARSNETGWLITYPALDFLIKDLLLSF